MQRPIDAQSWHQRGWSAVNLDDLHGERARQAEDAALSAHVRQDERERRQTLLERWQLYVALHPNMTRRDGTRVEYDPMTPAEWPR